jgi:hypothetical protein
MDTGPALVRARVAVARSSDLSLGVATALWRRPVCAATDEYLGVA